MRGYAARAAHWLRMAAANNGWLGMGARLLLSNPARAAAAFASMAVAVVVMFVEFGLLLGILESQSVIATRARGDLIVMHDSRTDLHKWTDVDRIRLAQIASMAEVAAAIPVYQGAWGVRDPDGRAVRRIQVFAFPPHEAPLDIGDPDDIARALETANTVLFDRLSRPIFGDIRPGRDVELDGRIYRVGGYVEIGPDIVHDGALVMSEGSWRERDPNANPIMGVIRLKDGVGVDDARRQIVARLPSDVTVMTPAEVRAREIDFTLRTAPIGVLFGAGMLAGLVIGAVTCYQVLFNEIIDRVKQYATLKAMGFSDGFLKRIVLEQAFVMAGGGFAAGLIATWIVYLYIASETALMVQLSAISIATVLVLAAGMAAGAGLAAMRRVTAADPADLY